MRFKLPLEPIKRWFFALVVNEIKKVFTSQSAREKVKEWGAYIGRSLGRAIPGEHVEGFLAAFAKGFGEGLDEQDEANGAHNADEILRNLGNS